MKNLDILAQYRFSTTGIFTILIIALLVSNSYHQGLASKDLVTDNISINNSLNTDSSTDIQGLEEGVYGTVYGENDNTVKAEFRKIGDLQNSVKTIKADTSRPLIKEPTSCEINLNTYLILYTEQDALQNKYLIGRVLKLDGTLLPAFTIKQVGSADSLQGARCSNLGTGKVGVVWYQKETGSDEGIYLKVWDIEGALPVANIYISDKSIKQYAQYPDITKVNDTKAIIMWVQHHIFPTPEYNMAIFVQNIDLTGNKVGVPRMIANSGGKDAEFLNGGDQYSNHRIRSIKYTGGSSFTSEYAIAWIFKSNIQIGLFNKDDVSTCNYQEDLPLSTTKISDMVIHKNKVFVVISQHDDQVFKYNIDGIEIDVTSCNGSYKFPVNGTHKRNTIIKFEDTQTYAKSVKIAVSKGDDKCSIFMGVNFVTNQLVGLARPFSLHQMVYLIENIGALTNPRCLFGCPGKQCYQCIGTSIIKKALRDKANACICIDGYYDNPDNFPAGEIDCLRCSPQCSSCQEKLASECKACSGLNRKAAPTCECQEKFYFIVATHVEGQPANCLSCMAQCKTCIVGDKCVSCVDPNRQLDQCLKCNADFAYYKDVCILCNSEGMQKVDKGQPDNTCECVAKYFPEEYDNSGVTNIRCNKCKDECATCTSNAGCTVCQNATMKPPLCNQCDETKNYKKYTNSDGAHICLICNETNQISDGLIPATCICEDRFFAIEKATKDGFICSGCIAFCQKCINNTSCQVCINNKHDPAVGKNCTTCLDNTKLYPDCICNLNTQVSDGAGGCTNCAIYCTSCTNTADNCTACKGNGRSGGDCSCGEGYRPSSKDSTDCVACDSDKCKKCDSTGKCDEWNTCILPGLKPPLCLPDIPCVGATFLDAGKCIPCLPTCLTCSSGISCNSCLTQNPLKYADCLQKDMIWDVSSCQCKVPDKQECPKYCDGSCQTKENANVCKVCIDNTYQPPECVCKLGQFWDSAKKECTGCNSACSSCTGVGPKCDGSIVINNNNNSSEKSSKGNDYLWLYLLIAGLVLLLLLGILLAVYLKKRREKQKIFNKFGKGQFNPDDLKGDQNNSFGVNSLDTMNNNQEKALRTANQKKVGDLENNVEPTSQGLVAGAAAAGTPDPKGSKMFMISNAELLKAKEEQQKKQQMEEEEEEYYEDSAYQQSYEQLQQIKKNEQEKSSTGRTSSNLFNQPYGYDPKLASIIKKQGTTQRSNWNGTNPTALNLDNSEINNSNLENKLDITGLSNQGDQLLLVPNSGKHGIDEEDDKSISNGKSNNQQQQQRDNDSLQAQQHGSGSKPQTANSNNRKMFNTEYGSNFLDNSIQMANFSNGFDSKSGGNNTNRQNISLQEKKNLKNKQKQNSQLLDIKNYQQNQLNKTGANSHKSSNQDLIGGAVIIGGTNGAGNSRNSFYPESQRTVSQGQNGGKNSSNPNIDSGIDLLEINDEDSQNNNNNNIDSINKMKNFTDTTIQFGSRQNTIDNFGGNQMNKQENEKGFDNTNNGKNNFNQIDGINKMNTQYSDQESLASLAGGLGVGKGLNNNNKKSIEQENELEFGQNGKNSLIGEKSTLGNSKAGKKQKGGDFMLLDDKEILADQHQNNARNYNKNNKVYNINDKKMEQQGKQDLQEPTFAFKPFVHQSKITEKSDQGQDNQQESTSVHNTLVDKQKKFSLDQESPEDQQKTIEQQQKQQIKQNQNTGVINDEEIEQQSLQNSQNQKGKEEKNQSKIVSDIIGENNDEPQNIDDLDLEEERKKARKAARKKLREIKDKKKKKKKSEDFLDAQDNQYSVQMIDNHNASQQEANMFENFDEDDSNGFNNNQFNQLKQSNQSLKLNEQQQQKFDEKKQKEQMQKMEDMKLINELDFI